MENNKSDNYRVPQDAIDAQQLEDSLKKPGLSDQQKGTIYCRLGLFYFFNKDAKQQERAYHFFKNSMKKNDLLGSAYLFLCDSFKDEELDNNLTDFLKTKDLSVDQLLTLSQTNAYAAYLLGRIYEEGLFDQDKKVDNKKAIEYFKKSLKNPALKISSQYHLSLIEKDNTVNKENIIEYLEQVFKKKPDFNNFKKWASLFKKLETNIFQINKEFYKILKVTSVKSKFKEPLEKTIGAIDNIGYKTPNLEAIQALKKQIDNFLKLMNETELSRLSLSYCREKLEESFKSPKDAKNYLKSRMIFLSIYLKKLNEVLAITPNNLKNFISQIDPRLSISSEKDNSTVLETSYQDTSNRNKEKFHFRSFTQWALFKMAELVIPKKDNQVARTITQNIFEYQSDHFFQKKIFSKSVNFGLKSSREKALNKVVKILEKNKEKVFKLSLHLKNSTHILGLYMQKDRKIELIDLYKGGVLFNNSQEFINHFLKKKSIIFNKGKGKIELYKSDNFNFLKIKSFLLLSLLMVKVPLSVSSIKKLICKLLNANSKIEIITSTMMLITLLVLLILPMFGLKRTLSKLKNAYNQKQLINKLQQSSKKLDDTYKPKPTQASGISPINLQETKLSINKPEKQGQTQERDNDSEIIKPH